VYGINTKNGYILLNMSKQIAKLLFLLLFFNAFFYVQAQENNGIVVEVSKEKTTINGKNFYIHTVKKGENLYRISKAYNITQKDIMIANPETISGSVKEGTILKIPIDPATPRSIQQIESDNFIYHIIEEQQTITFLIQKYNITKEELYKYNPELEFPPLQVGQVVRIPKSQNVSANAETFQPIENYQEYKVKRKETKYSISKDFNITVDELIAANPILNSEDLKAGSVIRIPRKSDAKFDTKELLAKGDSIVKINKEGKPKVAPVETVVHKNYTGELKIALLMPFSCDDNEARVKLDSIAAANANKNHTNKNTSSGLLPRTVYALEFYQGFLVAVDSLKKTGVSVKLSTYDTERDASKVNKILSKPALQNMDLIVGPLFQEGLGKANDFSLKNHVKLVSPIINENINMAKNPYLFQFIPSERILVDAMIRQIATYAKKKIILVECNDQQNKAMTQLFKERLNAVFPNSYKTISSSSINTISHYYSESEDNIVLIPSINEAFIFTIFSKLSLDAKSHSIKVYGMPNCVRFKNFDQHYFHNLEFHYYTPFYFDYSDPSIKHFISVYKKMFLYEPQDFTKEGYNFALLGFDLGCYFIEALSQKDGNLENSLNGSGIQPLHMKIRFAQDSVSGNYVNQEVQIMEFTKDFYLKKAN
jgi:LysM repeat protein